MTKSSAATLAAANLPTGLCTIAWAAERLNVSQRQVLRYVESGLLHAVTPERGSKESMRHKRLLSCGEVRTLAVKRSGHLRDDDGQCFPSCPHRSHDDA